MTVKVLQRSRVRHRSINNKVYWIIYTIAIRDGLAAIHRHVENAQCTPFWKVSVDRTRFACEYFDCSYPICGRSGVRTLFDISHDLHGRNKTETDSCVFVHAKGSTTWFRITIITYQAYWLWPKFWKPIFSEAIRDIDTKSFACSYRGRTLWVVGDRVRLGYP